MTPKGDLTGGTKWSEELVGESGRFRMHFPNKGTYHYSTGKFDGATMGVSGTLRVVEATDKPARVNVYLNGVEATHSADSTHNQPNVNDCDFFVSTTPAQNTAAGGVHVHYSYGATPVMTSFAMINKASNLDDDETKRYIPTSMVRMWFSGFKANKCSDDFEVYFGESSCVEDARRHVT